MKHHKAAELFPMLAWPELEDLADDIKAHGQREEIVTLDGKVLDGRNRLEACRLAKVSPRLRVFGSDPGDGLDPVKFVISQNLKRRHLNDTQRALIAAGMVDAGPGKPAPEAVTKSKAAKLLNVSESAVKRAVALEDEPKPVQVAVKTGEMSLSAAVEPKKKEKPIHKPAPKMKPVDTMMMALDDWWLKNKEELRKHPAASPESMMKHFARLILKTFK